MKFIGLTEDGSGIEFEEEKPGEFQKVIEDLIDWKAEYEKLVETNRKLLAVVEAAKETLNSFDQQKRYYFSPLPCPDKIEGCLVNHGQMVDRFKELDDALKALEEP